MWLLKSIVISPFLLVQFLVLALKGDGNWNWGVVFIPLYLLFALCLGLSIYSLVNLIKNEKAKNSKKIYSTFTLLSLICAILFGSFLTAQLNYGDWPWAAVFSPIWVFLFFVLFYVIASHQKLTTEGVLIYSIIWVHAVVFSILLVFQLGNNSWNWGIVFIPVWSFLLVWIIFFIISIKKNVNSSIKARGLIEIFLEGIIIASLLIFMILLVVSLDKVGHSIAKISLYSPLLFCFSSTFLLPYVYYMIIRRRDKERFLHQQYTPGLRVKSKTEKTRDKREQKEEKEKEEAEATENLSNSSDSDEFIDIGARK